MVNDEEAAQINVNYLIGANIGKAWKCERRRNPAVGFRRRRKLVCK